MILPKTTGYFPRLKEVDKLAKSADRLGLIKKQYSATLNLLSSYLNITSRTIEGRSAAQLNEILQGYYGYIAQDVFATQANACTLFNRAKRLLIASTGYQLCSDVRAVGSSSYMTEALEIYRALPKRLDLIEMYNGDFVKSRQGKAIFVNVIELRKKFPNFTKSLMRALSIYLGRYPSRSAATENNHVRKVLAMLCKSFSCDSELNLLQDPATVNKFFAMHYDYLYKAALQDNSDMGVFGESWRCCIRVVENLFVAHGLIAAPAYKIPCPAFKKHPHETKTRRRDKSLSEGLTDFTITLSDDEAADKLLDDCDKALKFVESLCQHACEITLQTFRRRIALADAFNNGEVIEAEDIESRFPLCKRVDDYEKLAKQCAIWETRPFGLSQSELNSLFGKDRRTASEQLGLLNPGCLMPFLYLLVNEHPSITPSWLENFKLFNKHGIRHGLRRSGGRDIAVSVKRRKGSARATQRIFLNKKSKQLFDDIVEITGPARQHLSKSGDQDATCLLLGGNSGLMPAKAITLGTQANIRYSNSLLTKIFFAAIENAEDPIWVHRLYKRLSLRAVRRSRAVQLYLETRSVRKMSKALGHESYNPKLLLKYLPIEIVEFFSNRWARIFMEGMIIEAMKDSEYLLSAVSFNTISDIERFLKTHPWKPVPAALSKGFGPSFVEATKALNNDKLYIPVSDGMCSVLMSLHETFQSRERAGACIPEVLKVWEGTAKLLACIKSADEELVALPISSAALVVIKRSQPDFDLIAKFNAAIDAGVSYGL